MKTSMRNRHARAACAAVTMLAGCSGSQPPIGVTGAMPQSLAPVSVQAAHKGSWMLPEAKNEDLIYISDDGSSVYVFSYPAGKLVGTLTGFSGSLYECVDSSGNVFITNFNDTQGVDEYAHGGTEPINVLKAPEAGGCSVDPTTGNLAVATNSDVLYVFPDAQGTPTEYTDSSVSYITDVAYDGSGNLFFNGALRTGRLFLMELPSGSGNLETINIPYSLENSSTFQPMLWDGNYLTMGSEAIVERGKYDPAQTVVNRLQISGSEATIVGTTKRALQPHAYRPQYWIRGGIALQPSDLGNFSRFEYFTYPQGNKTRKISANEGDLWGATLSLAPSGKRNHQ
jgi:hypothetical protein